MTTGHADCHPWVALLAGGVIVYVAARNLRWVRTLPAPGGEGDGGFLGPRVRRWYRECMAPFEEALAVAGVGPDALTYAQLVVAALAGAAFASGAMFLGGWLVIAAGTLDILDGGLARRRGGGTPRGAYLDSVVDRYAELLTLAGLAVYFRHSWVLWAAGLALFGSLMVSYARARAEGLGVDCPVGGSQRPERIVLIGFGAVASDLAAHLACSVTGARTHGVLAVTVVVLAGLTNATALERAWWVARRLTRAR